MKEQLEKDLAEHINPDGHKSVEQAFEDALREMCEKIRPVEEVERTKISELKEDLEKDLLNRDDFSDWL